MARVLEYTDFREPTVVGDLSAPVHAPNAGGSFWNGTASSLTSPLFGPAQGQSVVGPNSLVCKRVGEGGPSGGVRVIWRTSTIGVDQLVCELTGTGGTSGQLRVNTSNQLYLQGVDPGGNITSTTTIAANTTYESELWWYLDDTAGKWRVGHGAVGSVAEIAALTGGGIDTQVVGGAELDGMRFDNANQTICQPILLCNDGAYTSADFIAKQGRLANIAWSPPSGDGADQDWDNVNNPGSSLYTEVSEVRSDGNTSTIIATVNGDRASFGTFNLNATTLAVSKVWGARVLIQHYCPDGFKHHDPFLLISGTHYFGVTGGFGFQWTSTVDLWEEDPSTATRWQDMTGPAAITIINAMEMGLEHNGSTSLTRCSHYSLTVLYTTDNIILTPDPLAVPLAEPTPELPRTISPTALSVPLALPTPGIGFNAKNPSALAVTLTLPAATVAQGPPPEPDDSFACDTSRQDQYGALLQNLLPWGIAWPRHPTKKLSKLLLALAHELACVHARALDLIREGDPRTTSEMLPDWEEAFGLPSQCTGPLGTDDERRTAVLTRLTEVGGQSPEYFVELAASLGFDVEVVEFNPFQVGRSQVGDALTNGQAPFQVGHSTVGQALTNNVDWLFTWAIVSADITTRDFVVGQGTAGDPLRTWGNGLLECVLGNAAPAHTLLLFLYRKVLKPDPAQVSLAAPVVTRV